jgi:hypothetical protein
MSYASRGLTRPPSEWKDVKRMIKDLKMRIAFTLKAHFPSSFYFEILG